MSAENPPVFDPGLADRVKGILLRPKYEWPIIAAEQATVKSLFRRYAMILAAIGPVATVVSGLVSDDDGIFTVLLYGVVSYGLNLLAAYILGIVIDGVAHNFGSEKNIVQSMKLAVYAMTPFWVLGILNLIPGDAPAVISLLVGIYGAYLVYCGLGPLKLTPPDKQLVFTIVLVIVWGLLTAVVVGLIMAVFMAFSVIGEGAMAFAID
ncbi:Yip1 family protein [Brevundimonas terrae]|nr:Yip1 family protein [Brevundimonas terrae]NIJ27128.1 xanthine/uracil permease [Brevundimonas terrae]